MMFDTRFMIPPPGLASILGGKDAYPKQWSEIFKEFKEKQKDEEMIKFDRDVLIGMLKYRIATLSGRVCNQEDTFYSTLDAMSKLRSTIDILRNVMNSAAGSEFEVSLIGAKDLTTDSEEVKPEEVKADD